MRQAVGSETLLHRVTYCGVCAKDCGIGTTVFWLYRMSVHCQYQLTAGTYHSFIYYGCSVTHLRAVPQYSGGISEHSVQQQSEVWKEVCVGLHVKYCYCCPSVMKLEFYQHFRKISKFQISWKSVQWKPSCSMRTDGQTWRSGWLPLAVLWKATNKTTNNTILRRIFVIDYRNYCRQCVLLLQLLLIT